MTEPSQLIVPAKSERVRNYQPPALTGNDSSAIMQIIERASREPDFDITKIQQLLELKERWDANEARKAYMVAMAAFKADPPKIYKNKHVAFKNKAGTVTEYDHATHSEVVEKIAASLGQHGLSHRWNIEQKEGLIRVTCVITHALGHSDQVAMTAAPDISGSKSDIQAVASTCTLLQRYTLIAATGLTAADLPDADDRKDDEDNRPELPLDVINALKAASEEGSEQLGAVFRGLTEQTRGRIVADYSEEWTALKADAAKVKQS